MVRAVHGRPLLGSHGGGLASFADRRTGELALACHHPLGSPAPTSSRGCFYPLAHAADVVHGLDVERFQPMNGLLLAIG